MKISKLLCTFVIVFAILVQTVLAATSSSTKNIGAMNKYNLSSKSIEFLSEHNIDFESIVNENSSVCTTTSANTNEVYLYNDGIESLIDEASAYNFTESQINDYVTGIITTPATIVRSSQDVESSASTFAVDRPWDNGIGYEVKTVAGYFHSTAYVTLPTVHRTTSSQYMFYTVSSSETGWGIDVGLWYAYGNGGEGWRGCYTASGNSLVSSSLISGLTSGSRVYFNCKLLDDGYLNFKVLDANDFSKVYYNINYYVGDHGIFKYCTHMNRQISLCNNTANFEDGSYSTNAIFDNAYIYNSTGYTRPSASTVIADRCGVFGTNTSNRSKVVVNSYNEWYSENVSIYFN